MKRFAFIAVIAALAPVCFPILLSRVAIAAECGPTAILEGNPAILLPIREILTSRGVSTAPENQCPSVRARVERRDQVLVVRVTDSHGRESKRTVDDAEAAATLIESWVRSDIGLKLIKPPELESQQPEEKPEEDQEPEPKPAKPKANIFVAGEGAWGNEGSLWAGGFGGACGHLGPACLGGLFRYSSNVVLPESSKDYELSRFALDGMITLDFPLSANVVFFSPGVGVGAGWIQSSGMAQGTDPEIAEGRETFDTWGPAVQVHLTFGKNLSRGFNMALTAAFKSYIPSHADDFRQDNRELPGEPWGMGSLSILFMYGL